ncbi:MAG: bacterio-opsin activator domain-containing protein, partial [Halobacteriales archaeon]
MTTATVVELEFQVADSTYPFVQGSTLADGCRFELQSVVPQTDGSYLEFWNVTDDPPSQLDWRPQREGVEGWLLADPTDAGLFVFRISTTEIDWAPTLAAEGAIPREVWSDDGTGVIVADVLPWRDATDVVATVQCEHPSVTLTAKR